MIFMKNDQNINEKLLAEISSQTGLSQEYIKNRDIEEIEKSAGIIIRPPKTYFAWELGGYGAWPDPNYKFISPKILEKQERKIDKELKKMRL